MDDWIKSFLDKQYSALSHVSPWFSLLFSGLACVLIIGLLSMTGRGFSIIPVVLFVILLSGRIVLTLKKRDTTLYIYYVADFLISSVMYFYVSFLFLTLGGVSNYKNVIMHFVVFLLMLLAAWKWTFFSIKKDFDSSTNDSPKSTKAGGYVGAAASTLICPLVLGSSIEYYFYSICMLFMGGLFLLLSVRTLIALILYFRLSRR